MKYFLVLFLGIYIFIVGAFFISLLQATNYDKNIEHSKVTLELIYENGIKTKKDFIIQSKNINSFNISTENSGIFRDGYPVLTVFVNWNSWSGVTTTIEKRVTSYKILKVQKL